METYHARLRHMEVFSESYQTNNISCHKTEPLEDIGLAIGAAFSFNLLNNSLHFVSNHAFPI